MEGHIFKLMKRRYILIPSLALIGMLTFGGTVYFLAGPHTTSNAIVDSSGQVTDFIDEVKQNLGVGNISELSNHMKNEFGQNLSQDYLGCLCKYFKDDSDKLNKFTGALYSQSSSLGGSTKPYVGSLFYLDKVNGELTIKVREAEINVVVKANKPKLKVDGEPIELKDRSVTFKSLPKKLELEASSGEFKDKQSLDMIEYFTEHNKDRSKQLTIKQSMFKKGYGIRVNVRTNIPKAHVLVNNELTETIIENTNGETVNGLHKGDIIRLQDEESNMSTVFTVDDITHDVTLEFTAEQPKGKQVMGLPKETYTTITENITSFLNKISSCVTAQDPTQVENFVVDSYLSQLKEQIQMLIGRWTSTTFNDIVINNIEDRNGYYVVDINANVTNAQGTYQETKAMSIQINIDDSGKVAYFAMNPRS